jgi:hypothetical protein
LSNLPPPAAASLTRRSAAEQATLADRIAAAAAVDLRAGARERARRHLVLDGVPPELVLRAARERQAAALLQATRRERAVREAALLRARLAEGALRPSAGGVRGPRAA